MTVRTVHMSKQHLVVIGNGMVGHHFLEQLMASPAAATYHLRVFGAEQHPAYDRVHLSDYFSGAGHRELALARAGLVRATRHPPAPGRTGDGNRPGRRGP